jgi:hypothetical protein
MSLNVNSNSRHCIKNRVFWLTVLEAVLSKYMVLESVQHLLRALCGIIAWGRTSPGKTE